MNNKLIIQLICPDQKGIIAEFTHQLYQNKINIISLEQHLEPDENIFFMRIHADTNESDLDYDELLELLNIFKIRFKAEINF